jgi:hypothetical protein
MAGNGQSSGGDARADKTDAIAGSLRFGGNEEYNSCDS